MTSMTLLGAIVALNIVALTVWLLFRKNRPEIILLAMGFVMFAVSYIPGFGRESGGNFFLFDIFENLCDVFVKRFMDNGLMIMLICGYVGYMRHIKASEAIAYALIQPTLFLKRSPHLAAIAVIPFGILLRLAIPSAAGLALLLAAVLYPLLLTVGVSKLTALSVIAATTILDIGVNSPGAVLAANGLDMSGADYLSVQLRVALPLILVIMLVYYLYSSRMDRKEGLDLTPREEGLFNPIEVKGDAPLYYSVLPILPLLFSVAFSLVSPGKIHLSLSAATLLSFVLSAIVDGIRRKSARRAIAMMPSFWKSMGEIFSSVVILIVAADFFAQGLLGLGIDKAMVQMMLSLNMGKFGVVILTSFLVFLLTVLTGSGIASFASIGPIIPSIAAQVGMDPLSLMVPVQLTTGIARAVSPIAIVIIVLANVGNVDTIKLVRRNIVPVLVITLSTLLISTLTV